MIVETAVLIKFICAVIALCIIAKFIVMCNEINEIKKTLNKIANNIELKNQEKECADKEASKETEDK